MDDKAGQSLDERARLLAIQSLKEQARRKAKQRAPQAPVRADEVRSQVVGSGPGLKLTDSAAQFLARAIKDLLHG